MIKKIALVLARIRIMNLNAKITRIWIAKDQRKPAVVYLKNQIILKHAKITADIGTMKLAGANAIIQLMEKSMTKIL